MPDILGEQGVFSRIRHIVSSRFELVSIIYDILTCQDVLLTNDRSSLGQIFICRIVKIRYILAAIFYNSLIFDIFNFRLLLEN